MDKETDTNLESEPEKKVTDDNISMEELLRLETLNRFKNPWSKLDKGTKLNRIGLFVKKEKIKNNLNNNQERQLKELLVRIIHSGGLNKVSEISYSIEETEIKEIKHLNYDSEKNKYSYAIVNKNKKTDVSKSKSNIDRHFHRSKDKKK